MKQKLGKSEYCDLTCGYADFYFFGIFKFIHLGGACTVCMRIKPRGINTNIHGHTGIHQHICLYILQADTFPFSITRRIWPRKFRPGFRFSRRIFDIGNFEPSPRIMTEESEISTKNPPPDSPSDWKGKASTRYMNLGTLYQPTQSEEIRRYGSKIDFRG